VGEEELLCERGNGEEKNGVLTLDFLLKSDLFLLVEMCVRRAAAKRLKLCKNVKVLTGYVRRQWGRWLS
jgi:hypothetical protein